VEFNRFDVAAKELVWDDPAAWLEWLGIAPVGPVEVIDSDITALTASADKVIRVSGPEPYLVNIELQSYHDTTLVRTLWFRQVALDYRHDLPVLTVLVLLCAKANSPSLTGTYERNLPAGLQTNRYNYKVVRLWQDDPELYMNAGLSLVPLAPLTAVSLPDVPGLIQRMKDRINSEPPPLASKLWTAAFLLMGLRFSDDVVMRLLEGIQIMQESTTYQRILREGRQEGLVEGRQEGHQEGRLVEARQFLRRLGTQQFGEPDDQTVAALEAIRDVERLEALGEQVLRPGLKTWKGLLQSS
jgi:predicted transposase YdaD